MTGTRVPWTFRFMGGPCDGGRDTKNFPEGKDPRGLLVKIDGVNYRMLWAHGELHAVHPTAQRLFSPGASSE